MQPAARSVAVTPSAVDSIPSRRAADRAEHGDRLPFVDDDGDLLEVVTRVDALQTLAR